VGLPLQDLGSNGMMWLIILTYPTSQISNLITLLVCQESIKYPPHEHIGKVLSLCQIVP
jgi:hypothetical protein